MDTAQLRHLLEGACRSVRLVPRARLEIVLLHDRDGDQALWGQLVAICGQPRTALPLHRGELVTDYMEARIEDVLVTVQYGRPPEKEEE